jgi:tetratricopeptide (TPR) repeat protein
MNNLAIAYEEAGKFDLSLPLKEEALRLKKAKLGLDHPSTLTGMGNLAEGYRRAGKLDLALPLYKETIERMKARIGLHHPGTLATMNNLGLGYRAANRLDLALPLVEETLGLMKAHLPPGHPNILKAMGNLAVSYQEAGKLDLALPLFVETLKLQKAKLGPDHPTTLSSMGNLATCYRSLGQLDKSVPLFEEVVKRYSAVLGRQHPETLLHVANLGVNYKDAGRLAEALPLLEEGYLASKKNPKLRWVGAQLLDWYTRAKETIKAKALVKELLHDARRTLPPESPALAGMLANLGSALLTARSFADAEPLLRESLSIRERKEPDAWTTFNTRALLGGALLGQDQFAAAEPLLLAGYEGMKQREKTIPPQGRPRLAEAAGRLVRLYTATNKKDELKRWQAEGARYPEAGNSPLPEKKRSLDRLPLESRRPVKPGRHVNPSRAQFVPRRRMCAPGAASA